MQKTIFMDYLIVIVLLVFSALFSGLTLGFFSLSRDDLERKAKLGDKNAKKVFALRKNGNLLLCTLLVGNVAVNSTMSIFLGSLVSGVIAGLTATCLIVVFGEIVPQAFFARFALRLGHRFVWLARLLEIVLFPVCWPLAAVLDKILGDEIPGVYSKHEIIKLIEDHEDNQESDIDADEERILKGALSFSDKTVGDIMTPRTTMFALHYKTVLDKKSIESIRQAGHSRIPVYEENRDEIVGLLYVKDLINIDWRNKTVGDVARADVIFVDEKKKLDDLLNKFKKSRHHLFIVSDEYGSVSGLVTIEDVIEEIIGEEIVDEYDRHEDMQKLARQKILQKIKRERK